MSDLEKKMWECEDHHIEYTDKDGGKHLGIARCFCSSYEMDGEALLIFENDEEYHPIYESNIQEIKITD